MIVVAEPPGNYDASGVSRCQFSPGLRSWPALRRGFFVPLPCSIPETLLRSRLGAHKIAI